MQFKNIKNPHGTDRRKDEVGDVPNKFKLNVYTGNGKKLMKNERQYLRTF